MTNNNDDLTFWAMPFLFEDWDVAGGAYERCRDAIFKEDADASVYRIRLNGRAYVVIVGFGLPEESFVERMSSICRRGETAAIPDQVTMALALRRGQLAAKPGTRFERRANI